MEIEIIKQFQEMFKTINDTLIEMGDTIKLLSKPIKELNERIDLLERHATAPLNRILQ